MKVFDESEIREAYTFAMEGGQALHCHRIVFPDSPQCFKSAVKRGEDIGHLFDQDATRLKATARKLGVNIIFIHHEGTHRQHIDLCGKPMARALLMCEPLAAEKQ